VLPAGHEAVGALKGVKRIIGKDWIIAPYNYTKTTTLREYFDVDAPISRFYDYCGGSPFQVQRLTCEFLTLNKRAYVLNGMGTGKTRAGIWALDYLKKEGTARRALVVAPLSTLVNVWAKEIAATVPGLKAVVVHGTRKQRLKRLGEDADIYIINHDGVKAVFNELMAR